MIATLLALAAAAFPHAPATSPGLAGTWEGTLGTQRVRACFAQREWGAFGAYYYLSHLQLVPLEAVENRAGTFSEGGSDAGTARWRIDRADATTLVARWTGGGRTLPIRLHRLTHPHGDDSPCGSFAFHRPRLTGIGTVRSRATLEGVAYTKLALDNRGRFDINIQTFALDGDSPAVRRINTALGRELAGNPPHWFECIGNALEQDGGEGDEDATIEPAMISRRWLSVADQGFYSCGGAHPDGGSVYRTFDLTDGAEVDLLDWFSAAAVKRERFAGSTDIAKTLEPAFRSFILTDWHPGADMAECDEVVRSQDYWNVGLTRNGFVFTPQLAHVVQACAEEITIDFDRIRPWLTAEGAAKVTALRAERP